MPTNTVMSQTEHDWNLLRSRTVGFLLNRARAKKIYIYKAHQVPWWNFPVTKVQIQKRWLMIKSWTKLGNHHNEFHHFLLRPPKTPMSSTAYVSWVRVTRWPSKEALEDALRCPQELQLHVATQGIEGEPAWMHRRAVSIPMPIIGTSFMNLPVKSQK